MTKDRTQIKEANKEERCEYKIPIYWNQMIRKKHYVYKTFLNLFICLF